ncbi:hypothetical protein NEOLEDRAFT_750756 [Neolentinus lepideus HHB14362 ss-1]|uniref:Uncharacterized protein n=1 Tax=Neolentinus lepideus HHB14362 ss-1 TaxID=1314782 RepID=A0A165PU86_9AGAM|nr:hypothetical protein NEOLEDRAFT_750756 [Neolentinus lepideus HHB14362 ss-1]
MVMHALTGVDSAVVEDRHGDDIGHISRSGPSRARRARRLLHSSNSPTARPFARKVPMYKPVMVLLYDARIRTIPSAVARKRLSAAETRRRLMRIQRRFDMILTRIYVPVSGNCAE